MRFLLVHRDQVPAARAFLDDLDAEEVEVAIYDAEKAPSVEVLERFRDCELALIGVRSKYRKALDRECARYGFSVLHSFTSLTVAATALRQWLVPVVAAPDDFPAPSNSFIEVAQGQPRLILADGALNHADELTRLRYKFAHRAARALSDYAGRAGTAVGDLSAFFPNPEVYYAPNGEIRVSYIIVAGGEEVKRGTTEQHLKKGDATTRENAARIYFDMFDFQGQTFVAVLYCGPHPKSNFTVKVHLPGS